MSNEDDFKKVRDEIQAPLQHDLGHLTNWVGKRMEAAAAAGGEEAARREMFAVCTALGTCYEWFRDILMAEGGAAGAAMVDEFVKDTRRRLLGSAAARLATEIKRG